MNIYNMHDILYIQSDKTFFTTDHIVSAPKQAISSSHLLAHTRFSALCTKIIIVYATLKTLEFRFRKSLASLNSL